MHAEGTGVLVAERQYVDAPAHAEGTALAIVVQTDSSSSFDQVAAAKPPSSQNTISGSFVSGSATYRLAMPTRALQKALTTPPAPGSGSRHAVAAMDRQHGKQRRRGAEKGAELDERAEPEKQDRRHAAKRRAR